MSLTCIYSKNFGMKVVTDDQVMDFLKTKEWFTHPSFNNSNCTLGEIKNEKIKKRKKQSEPVGDAI